MKSYSIILVILIAAIVTSCEGNSRAKLKKKGLDMIAANNVRVPGAGFEVETNVLTLITKEGETELPLMSKDAAADALLDAILARM